MNPAPFRQLCYTSLCTPGVDVEDILQQSRHNNAVDGITGLLWHGDGRFLQVLEGPEASVSEAYHRIAADPRHHDLTIWSDRAVETRQFGYWSMERGGSDAAVCSRLARRLADAPEAVRAAFALSATV